MPLISLYRQETESQVNIYLTILKLLVETGVYFKFGLMRGEIVSGYGQDLDVVSANEKST